MTWFDLMLWNSAIFAGRKFDYHKIYFWNDLIVTAKQFIPAPPRHSRPTPSDPKPTIYQNLILIKRGNFWAMQHYLSPSSIHCFVHTWRLTLVQDCVRRTALVHGISPAMKKLWRFRLMLARGGRMGGSGLGVLSKRNRFGKLKKEDTHH